MNKLMLRIIAPSVRISMDIQVVPLISAAELCRICALWIEDKSNKRYIAHSGSILIRKRTQSVFNAAKTLAERNVENDEIFYLF